MKQSKKKEPVITIAYKALRDGMGWSFVEVTLEDDKVKSQKVLFSDVFDVFRVRAVQHMLGDR